MSLRRKATTPILALIGAIALSMASANGDPQTVVMHLEPGSILAHQAVRVALDEFKKRLFNTNGYRITVIQTGSSIWVTFQDPDLPAGWRGSSDAKPGFEVEVSQDASRVISAHFIR
jgi:hypothetical protein